MKSPYLTLKLFVFKVLRRVPLPLIGMFIGLIAGLAVWGVLDQIQSQAVKKIFDQELQARLDLRSRESLLRFNQSLSTYAVITQLLAHHHFVVDEMMARLSLDGSQPTLVIDAPPRWLANFFAHPMLIAPDYVLFTDLHTQVRILYQTVEAPLPEALDHELDDWLHQDNAEQPLLIRFKDQPYLVITDQIERLSGDQIGYLVVVVPINTAFLAAAEGMISADHSAVALIDSDEQRILATNEPDSVLLDSRVERWRDQFLITSQALPAYQGANWKLLFTTFVPQRGVDKISRHVVHFERRQRVVAAVVFILVFNAVIYLVSVRLNKVLARMTLFAQRALGIEQPGFRRGGNQLLLLEEWIQQFTQLVLRAREEMKRRHESEMRATEALKAAIMEAALDAIVTLDRAGRIIDSNPAAERILGLKRREALGSNFTAQFIDPAHHQMFQQLLAASNKHGLGSLQPHARGELNARRRAEEVCFPVELSIVPMRLGDSCLYTLYLHDITKRKHAEREIKGLARFASESPHPILRVAADGVMTYANAASTPLINAWGTTLGARLPAQWCQEATQALAAGKPVECEDDLGSWIYALLLVPIAELGYVNIYARDITAVRRAEQASRQHQAELVHVCRLSTMGEVATGMAHEINQPLAAIVNYANGCIRRLHNGGAEPQALVNAMGQIAAQAQRAGEIIRRLRALVGKQPPVRTHTDLNHLVREVCSFVEFESERLGLQIALALYDVPIVVNVDLVQIEQVLLNLVRNALDALSECPAGTRQLRIETRRLESVAEVRICDNGAGIAPERMPHLFDPFFTTKETGMGMGLPISQTILNNHEGEIWAESVGGAGATFFVQLPLAR